MPRSVTGEVMAASDTAGSYHAAGISDFRFHDQRQTTASMLAAQGASLLEIADVLGHKTLAMVKRYCRGTSLSRGSTVARCSKSLSSCNNGTCSSTAVTAIRQSCGLRGVIPRQRARA